MSVHSELVQIILIAVGVSVGVFGIYMLTQKQPNLNRAGVLTFPFLPAMLFFIVLFNTSSSANADVIGQVSGPIAAYVIVAVLSARFTQPVMDFESLNAEKATFETQLEQLQIEIEGLRHERDKFREEAAKIREQIANPPSPRLRSGRGREFKLPGSKDRAIILQYGDIRDIRDIDVIVNSENTDMILARFYDRSLSGTLRYLDATLGGDGHVQTDNLHNNLQAVLSHYRVRPPVAPGMVYPTMTVGLSQRGVRYVFHAAAVRGTPGGGYEPVIGQLATCVMNSYRQFEAIADNISSTGTPITSMLFPLFGSGTAKLRPHEAAKYIIPAVINGMQVTPSVKETHLLAYSEKDLDAWLKALREIGLDEQRNPPAES